MTTSEHQDPSEEPETSSEHQDPSEEPETSSPRTFTIISFHPDPNYPRSTSEKQSDQMDRSHMFLSFLPDPHDPQDQTASNVITAYPTVKEMTNAIESLRKNQNEMSARLALLERIHFERDNALSARVVVLEEKVETLIKHEKRIGELCRDTYLKNLPFLPK